MSAMKQMPMQTPQDLFMHELSDIHNAEQIIVQMLNEAQGLVENPQLKEGLRMHADQSRQHAQRVQQVMQQVGGQPHPVQCHAIEGMHKELQDARQANPSRPVLDGLVTGGAAKTEHYEIAAYTSLIEQAKAMGQTDAAKLLQQNLQEEQQMLKQVEQISRQLTQQMLGMTIDRKAKGQQEMIATT
jgi:ferritin-like metal-binding protein YciE